MKSKDLQNIVLAKRKNGKPPSVIFNEIGGAVSQITIKRWCKMISENGSIQLRKPPGRKRTARTKKTIQRAKGLLKGKKRVTVRKLAARTGISIGSAHAILSNDLRLVPYKIRTEPRLTDDHKNNRKKFFHFVKRNFTKFDRERIVFSDEKKFNVDGVYNSQNDRIWAVNRAEADEKGGVHQKRKFPQGIMVWLAASTEGLSPLVIMKKGTVNQDRYIKEILPVAKKYGDKVFGNNWTYQQDGATCHTGPKSIKWCQENLPNFIGKDHWPANSPDLNPLDYSVWNEFVRAINWNKVSSQTTLEKELKAAVKRINVENVSASCRNWYTRLYRVYKLNGAYLV